MEERGYLMDRQRDLEETFQPVVASNEKMAQDIIKDLAPINEGLAEMNRNIEIKREMSCPNIGSKRRLVSDYGPLAEAFIRNYMDDAVDKTFGIRYVNGKFMIGNKIIMIQGDNILIGNVVYFGTPKRILRNMMKKITRDTKSSFTKPMCSTVTMILEVVILQLTDRRNGKIFSIQFGKIFSMMELHPATTRLMMSSTSARVVVMVFVLCICRKMVAVSAFIVSVMEYISHHVHC